MQMMERLKSHFSMQRSSGMALFGPGRDAYFPLIPFLLAGRLPPGWSWVRHTRGSLVARQEGPSFPIAYYKEFLRRSPFESIKGLVRGTRCDRARKQGELLRKKGFHSPRVLCWGSQGDRHFMVTEGVDADGLKTFIEKHWQVMPSSEALRAKWEIIERLGHEIGRLHKTGIYHGDLRPNNVLVQKTGSGVLFHFIDNERNHHHRRLPLRSIEKNLSQLGMLKLPCVTLQDRLRFFGAYAEVYPRFSLSDARDLMRRVHRKTAARLTMGSR